MKRYLRTLILVVFGVFLVAGGANAFVLTLSDGSATITVADDGVGDANTVLGAITYIGPIGSYWIVNVTTGLSDPLIGGTNMASMDLNSVNLSTAAGTLTISLSDSFSLPYQTIVDTMKIGGTTNGAVLYEKYIGTAELDLTTKIGTLSFMQPGAFSGEGTHSFDNPLGTLSMTQVVTITHGTGNLTTSFDASNEATSVPVPATFWLLGAGLLDLVGIRRKFKN